MQNRRTQQLKRVKYSYCTCYCGQRTRSSSHRSTSRVHVFGELVYVFSFFCTFFPSLNRLLAHYMGNKDQESLSHTKCTNFLDKLRRQIIYPVYTPRQRSTEAEKQRHNFYKKDKALLRPFCKSYIFESRPLPMSYTYAHVLPKCRGPNRSVPFAHLFFFSRHFQALGTLHSTGNAKVVQHFLG